MGEVNFNPNTGELSEESYCVECGKQLMQGAKFCAFCGTNQKQNVKNETKKGVDYSRKTFNDLNGCICNGETIEALEIIKAFKDLEKDYDNDFGGNTLLVNAVIKGELKIIKALIGVGANIDLKSQNGGTPLFFAIHNRKLTTVKVLVELGANVSPYLEGYKNDTEMIEILNKGKRK